MIDSIRITHGELDCGTYRVLADFFRTAGIHVYGCVAGKSDKADKFDVCIHVTHTGMKGDASGETADSAEDSDEIVLPEIMDKETFEVAFYASPDNKAVPKKLMGNKYKEYVENYMNTCLLQINMAQTEKERVLIANDMLVLGVLAKVFASHDLLLHFNAYTVLYSDKSIVNEAQKAFAAAYKDFRKSIEGLPTSKYAIYAEMNIAKWINETCVFLGQRLIFDTKKCIDGLDRVLVMDPGFTSVYVLKAYMTEIDPDYDNLSEAYYRKALENIDSDHCKSYPCYRMGRYYEKIQKDTLGASQYYRKSYGMNRSEYRAIYKIILSQESQKDYLMAAESCNEICRILFEKETENYLQPREYEYLFKAYNERARIYGALYRDADAYELARNSRRRLCDSIRRENPMYKLIFGDRAAEFAERTYSWLDHCRHY